MKEMDKKLFKAKTAEEVRELIKQGADVNAKLDFRENGHDETPLHFVQDAEVAKALIEAGADVEAKNVFGSTPLMYYHNTEVTKVLIEAGADVNAKDNHKRTPVMFMQSAGSLQAMIDAGANIKVLFAQDRFEKRNQTLLHYAVYTPEYNFQVKQSYPVNDVEDLSRSNVKGCRPIHYIGDNSVVEVLLNAGIDVNVKDSNGYTPLYYAKDWQTKKLLVQTDAKNSNGQIPWYYVDDIETAKHLIATTADVNERDDKGNSPLYYARDRQIAKLLIEAGADVNARNNDGSTPLFEATIKDDFESVQGLLNHGADGTMKATFNKYEECGEKYPECKKAPLCAARSSKVAFLLLEKTKYIPNQNDIKNSFEPDIVKKAIRKYKAKCNEEEKQDQILTKKKLIEEKKAQYLKTRNMKISGTVIADMIVERIKSGVETRVITPQVGKLLRQEILVEKYGR